MYKSIRSVIIHIHLLFKNILLDTLSEGLPFLERRFVYFDYRWVVFMLTEWDSLHYCRFFGVDVNAYFGGHELQVLTVLGNKAVDCNLIHGLFVVARKMQLIFLLAHLVEMLKLLLEDGGFIAL